MKAVFASVLLGLLASLQAGEARLVRAGLLFGGDPRESESMKRGAALGARTAKSFGAEVRLAERGRPGQWGVEGNEAAALALDEQVDGMITPTGGTPAHQVLQVAGRTHLPVVSLCADSSVTAAGIPWAARIVPSTEDEAQAIFQATKVRKWAAILPPERDGREALADLKKAAARCGTVVMEALCAPSDPAEMAGACARLAKSKPDGVFVWLDAGGASAAGQRLRSAGFGGVLAGPGRLACQAFHPVEGFVVAVAPVSADFRQQFDREYGEAPDGIAAMAHDAVLLLARIGPEPAPRIAAVESFEGATGTIRFDAKGNRLVDLEVKVFGDGAWRSFSR